MLNDDGVDEKVFQFLGKFEIGQPEAIINQSVSSSSGAQDPLRRYTRGMLSLTMLEWIEGESTVEYDAAESSLLLTYEGCQV